MTRAEFQPHNNLGELPHKERTSSQKVFDTLMSRLDLLKFSSQLKSEDGHEVWSQKTKMKNLSGLSETTEDFLKHTRRLTLFVEYDSDVQRRFGLRNGDREIMFVLDKDREECVVLKGEKQAYANNQDWTREVSNEIPIEDGLLLAEIVDEVARRTVIY